ncbi:hypothetical protein PTI98_007015 [Pleurotus ostreatus]|nr:hypothetical protein PTI98_007015 [Pleurotus ostreatus]
MWDNRSTVDFIKSLFRVCGFVEPDLEEGVHWMRYSSTGRKTPPGILVAEPSGATTTVDEADSQVLGGEDEESDISEGGYDGDYSSFAEEDPLALSDDGSLETLSLETLFDEDEAAQEEEKAAVPTWCIIS